MTKKTSRKPTDLRIKLARDAKKRAESRALRANELAKQLDNYNAIECLQHAFDTNNVDDSIVIYRWIFSNCKMSVEQVRPILFSSNVPEEILRIAKLHRKIISSKKIVDNGSYAEAYQIELLCKLMACDAVDLVERQSALNEAESYCKAQLQRQYHLPYFQTMMPFINQNKERFADLALRARDPNDVKKSFLHALEISDDVTAIKEYKWFFQYANGDIPRDAILAISAINVFKNAVAIHRDLIRHINKLKPFAFANHIALLARLMQSDELAIGERREALEEISEFLLKISECEKLSEYAQKMTEHINGYRVYLDELPHRQRDPKKVEASFRQAVARNDFTTASTEYYWFYHFGDKNVARKILAEAGSVRGYELSVGMHYRLMQSVEPQHQQTAVMFHVSLLIPYMQLEIASFAVRKEAQFQAEKYVRNMLKRQDRLPYFAEASELVFSYCKVLMELEIQAKIEGAHSAVPPSVSKAEPEVDIRKAVAALKDSWGNESAHDVLHQKYQQLILVAPEEVLPRLSYARFRYHIARNVLIELVAINENLQLALRDLLCAQTLKPINLNVQHEIESVSEFLLITIGMLKLPISEQQQAMQALFAYRDGVPVEQVEQRRQSVPTTERQTRQQRPTAGVAR